MRYVDVHDCPQLVQTPKSAKALWGGFGEQREEEGGTDGCLEVVERQQHKRNCGELKRDAPPCVVVFLIELVLERDTKDRDEVP